VASHRHPPQLFLPLLGQNTFFASEVTLSKHLYEYSSNSTFSDPQHRFVPLRDMRRYEKFLETSAACMRPCAHV